MAELLPTEVLEWATNYVQETTDIDGKVVLVINKSEPPLAYKQSGILARSPLIRASINWVLNTLCRYVNHLVGRVVVGTIYTHESDIGTAAVEAQMGGTWVEAGQTTTTGTGAKTMYHFEKTA